MLKKPDGLPRTKGSVNKIKTVLKAFFGWLERSGVIPANPANSIRIKYYQRALPDILTDIEQKNLLKTLAQTRGQRAFRDRVIYTLLLNTGLRIQELVNLDIADINLAEKRLTITAKGGHVATRFLNARVRRVQRSFAQWVRAAGINKRLSIHSLRHTFASTLYEKSNNLLAVQQALGHRSITSTMIYTHLNPEQLIDSLENL